MKTFRNLVTAFIVLMSVTAMAHSSTTEVLSGKPPKGELENLLKELPMDSAEDKKVRVYFRLSDDKRIDYVKAFSEHENLNLLIEKRLSQKRLNGMTWTAGVVYELPLRIQL